MPNGTYGGVRGRKTKVGRKLLRFPPTRFLYFKPVCLNLQECVLAVQEVQEQPAHHDIAQVHNHAFHVFGEQAGKAGEEELVGAGEADHALRQIDGNGVHADNAEHKCPFLPSAYIYNIIEDSHHNERVCAYGCHKGA